MKILVASMKKQFVKEFVEWMKSNGIIVRGEPFETDGLWNVMYQPIGIEQKQKCKQFIEYKCNNGLM